MVSRIKVFEKYGGRCAYCGTLLGEKWHVDHLKAVHRDNGVHQRPDETIENLMPSCPPCNIYKATYSIEDFRANIERLTDVVKRSNGAYRHALRYDLIKETNNKVVFYFEKPSKK
jgi:5-methylcytosine-specific restriction endonuclease McrA